MKIIVDAMGGDFAPDAPVEGGLRAAKELGAEILFVGKSPVIMSALEKLGHKELPKGITIHQAEEVVEMCDNPATVMREKKDASMIVGLRLLKEGEGDAFVSAGSTGALLASATLMVKRVSGIRRAALAPAVPTANGSAILIDCGATAECTAEYLMQFAFMGSFYAKSFFGKENPKVGLLNIGEEPTKGLDLQKETYALLTEAKEAGRINFVGNVESKEAILGKVDVIVSDGYTGNVMLKAFEGTAIMINNELKKVLNASLGSKIGAMLMKTGLKSMKKKIDPNETGGTVLLGISKPVFKAHGSSNAYAIRNAIRGAMELAESSLISDISEHIDYMKLG